MEDLYTPYNIPVELVENILKYVPLRCFKRCMAGIYRKASSETYDKLFNERLDPRKFFSNIPNTESSFLELMTYSHVICTGSRAFSYFYPFNAPEDTPWEFCCQNHIASIVPFVLYFDKKGIEWKEFNHSTYKNMNVCNITGTFVYNRTKTTIRLMWNKMKLRSAHTVMSELPFSTYKCFVSPMKSSDMWDFTHSRYEVCTTSNAALVKCGQSKDEYQGFPIPSYFANIKKIDNEQWYFLNREEKRIIYCHELSSNLTKFAINEKHFKYMERIQSDLHSTSYLDYEIYVNESIKRLEDIIGLEGDLDLLFAQILKIYPDSDTQLLSVMAIDTNLIADTIYSIKPQSISANIWANIMSAGIKMKSIHIPF